MAWLLIGGIPLILAGLFGAVAIGMTLRTPEGRFAFGLVALSVVGALAVCACVCALIIGLHEVGLCTQRCAW